MRLSCFKGPSTIVFTLALMACDKGVSREPAPLAAQAPGEAAASAAPAPMSAAEMASQPVENAGEAIGGTILETMDSGGYTYLKLATPRGEVWTAVPQTKVQAGDSAMVLNAMLMTGFESTTLNRKFDAIYFGNLAAAAPPGAMRQVDPAAASATVAQAHATSSRNEKAGFDAPLPKAEGAEARSIEEVYAQKAELAGKPVAVRGKVMRVTEGVLNKTWLHLQDGSGTPEAANFDLTVTTDGKASEGDIVVARGVIATDKDLGHGYVYAVLLENAMLESSARVAEAPAKTIP